MNRKTEDGYAMLHAVTKGTGRPGQPALVLMHFLGGSTREWDEVVALLGDEFRTSQSISRALARMRLCPGTRWSRWRTRSRTCWAGCSSDPTCWSATACPARWPRCWHGDSRIVSSEAQLRMASGRGAVHAERLDGLVGLVLIAPSPPSPEPIRVEKRTTMLDESG